MLQRLEIQTHSSAALKQYDKTRSRVQACADTWTGYLLVRTLAKQGLSYQMLIYTVYFAKRTEGDFHSSLVNVGKCHLAKTTQTQNTFRKGILQAWWQNMSSFTKLWGTFPCMENTLFIHSVQSQKHMILHRRGARLHINKLKRLSIGPSHTEGIPEMGKTQPQKKKEVESFQESIRIWATPTIIKKY